MHNSKKHKQPVTTLSDAAQNVSEEKYLHKPDCSQAYNCIEKTRLQSTWLLSFASDTCYFANHRVAQSLNRSLQAFKVLSEITLSLYKSWKLCSLLKFNLQSSSHTAAEPLQNSQLIFEGIELAGNQLVFK